MTAKPTFHKVLRDDVRRKDVGLDGAAVLALVRFKLDGRDVVTTDGAKWWQASHTEMAALLGVPKHDTVRRIVQRLEKAGELQSVPTGFNRGGRLVAYRIPGHGSMNADVRPFSPPLMNADVRRNERGSASGMNADPRLAPIYKEEEKEKRTEGGDVAYLSWLTPPPLFCPKHPNGGIPCGACADLKRIGEAWKHTAAGKAWRLREDKAHDWDELGRQRMAALATLPPPPPALPPAAVNEIDR